MKMTLQQIRTASRQAALQVEERLLREAIQDHGWNLVRTARTLEASPSSVQRAVSRHPQLQSDASRLGPGRGRPREDA